MSLAEAKALMSGSTPVKRLYLGSELIYEPVPAIPKFHTFTDAFDTLDSAKWLYAPNASINAGQLQLSTSTTYQGATSKKVYDLEDSYVGLKVVKTAGIGGAGDTVDTGFSVELDGNNNFAFTREATQLYLSYTANGTWNQVGGTLVYDANLYRWWRIRHDTSDGQVKWQTSADGVTWTTRAGWTPTFSIKGLKAVLLTGLWDNPAGDLNALFDNFNI